MFIRSGNFENHFLYHFLSNKVLMRLGCVLLFTFFHKRVNYIDTDAQFVLLSIVVLLIYENSRNRKLAI